MAAVLGTSARAVPPLCSSSAPTPPDYPRNSSASCGPLTTLDPAEQHGMLDGNDGAPSNECAERWPAAFPTLQPTG